MNSKVPNQDAFQLPLNSGLGNFNKVYKNFQQNLNDVSLTELRQVTQQTNQFDSARPHYQVTTSASKNLSGREIPSFHPRAVGSQHTSPQRTIYQIADGTPVVKTSAQIFDSSTQGFPYMKKKHLHKASDIQQQIDEPFDDHRFMDDDENEKGTFTEEVYLNYKKYERTILLTVMEDKILQQQDKIQRLKEKLRATRDEKDESDQHLRKTLQANQTLHSTLMKVNGKIQELNQEQSYQNILQLLKDNEDIVVKCIKYQLDCLTFYKDIVTINRDNDGKTLKIKMDKYMQNEGQILNVNLFKQDYLENKLEDIQNMKEEVNKQRVGSLFNINEDLKKNIIHLTSTQEEFDLYQIYSSQQISQNYESKQRLKHQTLIQKYEQDIKLLRGKARETEYITEMAKSTEGKKILGIIKELDSVKQLLSKVQIQNVEYKKLIKDQKIGEIPNKNQKMRMSISDQTTLLMKKIKKLHLKNKDDISNLQKAVRANLKDLKISDFSQITKIINDFHETKARFQLVNENFKQELGSNYFVEIMDQRQNLALIEQRLNKIDTDFTRKYESKRNQIKSAEKEKQDLAQRLSIMEDEILVLRKATTDQNVQKTFEQISIILLQGYSDQYKNVLNEQQRQLIRVLFGHQVDSVISGFDKKLSELEKQSKQHQSNYFNMQIQLRTALENSLIQVNAILDLLNTLQPDQSDQKIINKYQFKKQELIEQLTKLDQVIREIKNRNVLGEDVAINEIDRKLSMIGEYPDSVDQSIEINRNISMRRSGSYAGVGIGKSKRYRDKIVQLQSKIELLQLENHQLQSNITKQASQFKAQQSIIIQENQEYQKIQNKMHKSRSDPKFKYIIHNQQSKVKNYLQNDNEDNQTFQIFDYNKSPGDQQNEIEKGSQLPMIESKANSRFYDSSLHFTPIIDRESERAKQKEHKLSQVLLSSLKKKLERQQSENPLMNPLVEEIVKQYEDQSSMLQNFVHSQALYIEEILTNNSVDHQNILLRLSNELPSNNLSLNSNSFLGSSAAKNLRVSRFGKQSQETNKSKSKSVTRYQNFDEGGDNNKMLSDDPLSS